MTPVLMLLLRHLRALRTLVRRRRGTKLVVLGLFALLFGLVMVVEYVVFRQALVEVLSIGAASTGLALYLLESLFVFILVISLLSFVATGLWTFYRAGDAAFLLSTPLPLARLFWLRTAETFFLTSWAFVVLAIPGLLALGSAYRRGAGFYLWALVTLTLFMALTAGLGTLLTTLAGAAVKRSRPRAGTFLATLLLAGCFAVLIGRQVVPVTGDFYLIFEPGLPNGTPASVKFIEKRFGFWPSHPFAEALFFRAAGLTAAPTALLAAAALLPIASLVAAGTIGPRLLKTALPVAAERPGVPRRTGGRLGTAHAPFPRIFTGAVGALLERDLKGFVGSPPELGRAAFILFLLVLSAAILLVAPLREALDKPETAARLFALNVMAVGYFLTAFGIRFIFPILSLEGRGAWVLFASPVPVFRLFLARLIGYSAVLAVVAGPVAMAGALRLARHPGLLGAFGVFLGVLTVTTVGVALAFGVLWPNFKETNAETLATNAGGLATTVVSLGYVAGMSALSHRLALALFEGRTTLPYLGEAAAVSIGIVAGATALARRRLKTLEIV